MSNLIKVIDPNEGRLQDQIERFNDQDAERQLKNPTEKDLLPANTAGQLFKKDEVTKKIKREHRKVVRFYKFTHPETSKTIYNFKLNTMEFTDEELKLGAVWISPEEYYAADEGEEEYRGYKGNIGAGRVAEILDIKTVRSSPELEKALRAR